MKPKSWLIMSLILIMLVPLIVGYDFKDFPEFINDSYTFLVVGDEQNKEDLYALVDIAESILEYYNCPTGAIRPFSISYPCNTPSKLANEVDDISTQNIISVGGPCANKITAQIMDLPTTWPECANSFEEGKSIIKFYSKWNKTQIVVAGYSAKDTRRASIFLTNLTKRIEIFTISNETLFLKFRELNEKGEILNYLPKHGIIPEIIEEKVNFLNNKWHVNYTFKYRFGCCSPCGPIEGGGCIALCIPCANKTKELYFKINNDGVIEEEIIEEKSCEENPGAWFRNITGRRLCLINWSNLDELETI